MSRNEMGLAVQVQEQKVTPRRPKVLIVGSYWDLVQPVATSCNSYGLDMIIANSFKQAKKLLGRDSEIAAVVVDEMCEPEGSTNSTVFIRYVRSESPPKFVILWTEQDLNETQVKNVGAHKSAARRDMSVREILCIHFKL